MEEQQGEVFFGPRKGLYMTTLLYLMVTQEPRADMIVLTDLCDGIKTIMYINFFYLWAFTESYPSIQTEDSALTLKGQWIP